MAVKRILFCKRCNQDTEHRLVKSVNEWPCVVCSNENSRKHRKLHWHRYLAQKANARKRPQSEKIEEWMILELERRQNRRCALSGILFDIESKWNRPSLDRIDNDKGYIWGNLRLVTWRINRMRSNLTDQEFVEICEEVTKCQTQ